MSVTSRQSPPVPERSNGARTDALLTGRRAPRAAAGGVRAVRRRGRQHARLPDRARRSTPRTRRVLLADTGGPTAGIAHYAGVETPRSLSEVSELLAAGLPVGQLLATTSDGLRVLATGPRLAADCARDGVELLLDHARRRYTLTVIDCGTLARQADQIALAKASHVAWVLPATAGAVDRGRKTLDALAPHPSGREMLLARHEPSDRRRALRELRDLARERRAPADPVPACPSWPPATPDAALETAQVPLQAILGALSAMNATHPSPAGGSPPAARPTDRGCAAGAGRSLELARLDPRRARSPRALIAGVVARRGRRCRRAAGLASRSPVSPARPAVAVGSSPTTSARSRRFRLLHLRPTRGPRPRQRPARLAVRLGELILAGAITANIARGRRALGAYGSGWSLRAHAARARRARRLLTRHRALPPRPPPQPARPRTWPRSRRRAWRCWRSPPCSRHG